MTKYRVIANSVNIHAGVLGLEPHQARARLHRLKPCGGNRDARDGVPLGGTGMNRYEVIDPPTSFKRGEEFEYDGELPKQLVESVASCPVPEEPFPVLDAELVTDAAPDDGVAEPPPDQSPELFEQDLFVEGVPEDGVSEPPAGAKKRSRRKPTA